MNNPTIKTKQLVELLLLRNQQYDEYTETIKGILSEYLFPILTEFLKTEPKNIEWLAVDIHDGILLISAMVIHKINNTPEFLDFLAPVEEDENDASVQRLIKIILPVILAFAPKETIIEYLTERLKKQLPEEKVPTYYIHASEQQNENERETTDPILKTPFSQQTLTREQQEMLSLFEITSSKTKQ